jgi:hypothetical protein
MADKQRVYNEEFMYGYGTGLHDDICGPGYTAFPAPSGAPDCYPDATTSPVAPPIDWGQILKPGPTPQPAPFPMPPMGSHPPPLSSGGSGAGLNSNSLLILGLIAGAVFFFGGMGGGKRR